MGAVCSHGHCELEAEISMRLRMLVDFSRKEQAWGDVVRLFTSYYKHTVRNLLLGGQAGSIRRGSDTDDANSNLSGSTLWWCVLCVILLWMFLPHVGVCALLCLAWKVHTHFRWHVIEDFVSSGSFESYFFNIQCIEALSVCLPLLVTKVITQTQFQCFHLRFGGLFD